MFFKEVTLRGNSQTPFLVDGNSKLYKFAEGSFSGGKECEGSSALRGGRKKRKTSSTAAAEREQCLRQCCR